MSRLRLPSDKLGQVRIDQPGHFCLCSQKCLSWIIALLATNRKARNSSLFDRCRGGEDGVSELEVVPIIRHDPELGRFGRVPNVDRKFIGRRSEQILGRKVILIDLRKNTRNSVVRDRDGIA